MRILKKISFLLLKFFLNGIKWNVVIIVMPKHILQWCVLKDAIDRDDLTSRERRGIHYIGAKPSALAWVGLKIKRALKQKLPFYFQPRGM